MKKIIAFGTVLFTLLFSFLPAMAAGGTDGLQGSISTVSVEPLENGDYLETVLSVAPAGRASSTQSGTKTTYYKNSDGAVMWSISVSASFSYQKGVSSRCTSVSGSASSNSSSWKVSSPSTSKSGNTATASATGKQYMGSILIGSVTKSVTLSCDTYGTLS